MTATDDSLLPIKGLICDCATWEAMDAADPLSGGITWDMGRLELILRWLGVAPITHEEARALGRDIDAELAERRKLPRSLRADSWKE